MESPNYVFYAKKKGERSEIMKLEAELGGETILLNICLHSIYEKVI